MKRNKISTKMIVISTFTIIVVCGIVLIIFFGGVNNLVYHRTWFTTPATMVTTPFKPGDPTTTPPGMVTTPCKPSDPTATLPGVVTTPFKPGDPTATPPGSEITDPDFIAGVEAKSAKDYMSVKIHMLKVIERNPDFAPPHWYLGFAEYQMGNYQAGLDQMNIALSIDSNYALAYADRGTIYMILGRNAEGMAEYQRALEIDPSLAKVHANIGAYYFNKGDYESAMEEYDLALAIDPWRESTLVQRAQALNNLGRYQECLESANQAISINPEAWEAYRERGACYHLMGNANLALNDLSRAVEEMPNDANSWQYLCYASVDLGKYENGIQACTTSINLNPDNYIIYVNRGWAYYNLENYFLAIDDFTRALEFGEIAIAYQDRGSTYIRLRQYDKAIEDYNAALALHPSGDVFKALGWTYLETDQFKPALEAFDNADQLEPEKANESERLWGKALAYYHLEQYDSSLALLTQMIEIYQYPEAYYYRGRIYEEKGMKTEAIQDYQAFITLAGQNPGDARLAMYAYDAQTRIDALSK